MVTMKGNYEKILKRHIENHMHGVLQLRCRALKYQRSLKDPVLIRLTEF